MDIRSLGLQCEASYCADFISREDADVLFEDLVTHYDLTNSTIKMADGSQFEAENRFYLFVDEPLMSYDLLPQVWGSRSVWPESLLAVRNKISDVYGTCFPVARCVFYQDGSESMAFHSDSPAYGATDAIASLSLGAQREFVLRPVEHKQNLTTITLASGTLLFMGGGCQEHYEHALLSKSDCHQSRLNITFRKYGWE